MKLSNKRCEICKLYYCQHIKAEHRSNLLDATPTYDIPLETPANNSSRIQIPPTVRVSLLDDKDQSSPQSDWVNCNLCTSRVHVKYLTQHMKVHANNFKPKASSTDQTPTSTSLVRVDDGKYSSQTQTSHSSTSYSSSSWSSSSSYKPEPDVFKFRTIDQVCISSSSSKDNRYSDFTVIVFGKEKDVVQNNTYSGYNSTTYKDTERLVIHTVYDAVDEYYTVSVKFLKRSQYSNWDTEDNVIPERICFQEELSKEIKRALIFFRFPPKAVFKRVLKILRSGDFKIEKNEDRILSIQSTDLDERLKKLNRNTVSSSWSGEY